MATPDEVQRIAVAMNALRPDWRINSLTTFLSRYHSKRAYRDLAIAAAVVATDPRTTTPNLLNEHGAWWVAAQAAAGPTPTTELRAARCPEPGHDSYPATSCGACRSEQLEATPTDVALTHQGVPRDRVRAILAGAHAPTEPDARTRAAGGAA